MGLLASAEQVSASDGLMAVLMLERQLVPACALRPRSYGPYPPGRRPRYLSGQTVDPTAEGPAGRLAASLGPQLVIAWSMVGALSFNVPAS